MSTALLLFLQLAACQAVQAPPPDIEVNAKVTAREVTIDNEGTASLNLHADPGVTPPIQVTRSAPPGAKSYRDLTIDLHAETHIGGSATTSSTPGDSHETPQP